MVDRLVNSEVNAKRIANVEYCFGMNGVPLNVPGRVLVGEGVLTKICRKKPKSRQFFLFNDILVYGTILINKKKYAQQHLIPLDGLAVEDLPDELVMKNGWLIKTSSKSFAVYAGSSSEKAEWIRHIKKCANDLLEQTGRKAPVEHAAVWVPDSVASVCMHCKQTQFTILNRRHHCLVCGGCSRNRVVILQQSKNPVRVCNTCYNEFYCHLTKPKKSSTCAMHSQTSTSSISKAVAAQQRANDAAEIQQVVRDCMDDTKDSRVEEWVSLASEQVSEHLSQVQKESDNNSLDEAIEAIKLDAEHDKPDVPATSDDPKTVEQLNGSKVDSYNDQTSDSDDDHLNDLSSVEDILDELIGKPTFYEDALNKDGQKEDAKNEPDAVKGGELSEAQQVVEVDDLKKETEKSVEIEKHLGDEKVNDEVSKESGNKAEIKEPSSETNVQTKTEFKDADSNKRIAEETDTSNEKCENATELCEEKTSF